MTDIIPNWPGIVYIHAKSKRVIMNRFASMIKWADTHNPRWLSVFRIILGVFLIYKGVQFMMGIEKLQTLPGGLDSLLYYTMLFHIVVFVHFVGGIFITLGLYTRWADVIQIPIILGALFLINDQVRVLISAGNVDVILSIIALVLLIVFLVFGSGKFSIDARKPNRQALT